VSLTVNPVNDAPVAVAQSVATDEDTAVAITLAGTDVDGDSLTYTVVQAPAKGTLSGTAPNLTYQPALNYNGPDSFTFQVTDPSGVTSTVATVSLTVNPVNDAPVATAQSVSTNEDTSVAVTLSGTDVEGDSLTYTVVQQPAHGTLSGTAPNLTYQPALDYHGPDSFTFQVTDPSGAISSPATVSLTVNPVNDAPVAVAQSVATDEDTAMAITLAGTDVDGDSLTYTVVQAPAKGTLSGTAPNLTYQPAADYHGSDSFTFRVTDPSGVTSTVATVSLTVRPVNDAPVALVQSAATDEETAVSITLAGTDVDGDSLAYTVVQQPAHGTLSGTAPNLTYLPALDYHGPDSFTFQVKDPAGATSNVATVSLTVRPVNDAPVATARSATTNEDTAVAITLAGTDVDGDSLTYTVVQQPAHGTLSGTAPNLTYQPALNYNGPDSFTFRVNDGQVDSAVVATVSLTVNPVNDAPVALAQSATTDEDTAVAITLAGTDVDGDSLTYTVVQQPTKGTLSGTAPNLTYQPALNYNGPDSFTFRVTDPSGVTSNVATVSLTVRPVNDAPVALAQSVATNEDTAVAITLAGTDVDGDSLTYTVVQAPAHGTLSGTAPNLTYRPALNYNGPDSFTFQARDAAGAISNVATVSLTVNPVNDAPVAQAQSVSTNEDTPLAIVLTCTDVEGDPLRFRVAVAPTKGTLSGTAPNLTYQPAAHYYGTDSFTFRCNDGKVDSNLGTISLTVQSVNDTPVAVAQSVSTDEDTPVAITLTGTDVEGDSLTYTVVQAPAHGTLSGTAPNLTYQPAADYHGPDSFTFQVTDSLGATSSASTVNLTVRPVNDAPVAVAQSVSTDEDTAVAITLAGTDVDGDSLTYTVVQAPAHGTLSGTAPNLTYQPAAHYHGPDSFTFQVKDLAGATSNVATVSLTVRSVNDVPVAISQSVSTDEDIPVSITLAGTDVEGDSLTYTVVQVPAHGTLSGAFPNLTYEPAAHYNGPDSFTFRVNDGQADSALATVSLTVRPIADAPVAVAQSVTTDEDTPVSITLVGTDADGDGLTYAVVQQPTKGTLSGTAPNLTYQPAADYHGPDSFTFQVTDASGLTSNVATVSLTVRPVNDAPVALAQSVTTNEDTVVAVTLTGTDVDGDSLTYTVVQAPANGTLSGTAPKLTYRPALNYHGPDSFTFQARDAAGAISNVATVSLTVNPVNDTPVAQAQSVSTNEDTPLAIVLTCTDVEGDPLRFRVAVAPTKGTVSGTAPNLTYQPAAHYYGTDSFTFRCNDGKVDSNLGTISLTVRSVNDAPVAVAQSVSTDENTAVAITLTGTDVEGESLTYTVVQAPAHGTLSGTPPNLTYQPTANYHGPDSFTFRVTDSQGATSSPGTVSLTVWPANDAPVAVAQSVTLDEDTSVAITLVGTDENGDSITYAVVQQPTKGTLSGTAPNLTYQPAVNYHGPDSFTFQVTDTSGLTSNVATVSLTVRPVNDAPVATSQSLTTNEDIQVAVTLTGTDVDGDSLTYTVVQAPANGTLSGTAPKLTYRPALNYHGPDSFTFQARDTAGAISNVATVSLTVNAVNDAPVAQAQSVSTNEDTPLAITLTCTDAEGDPLRFRVAIAPTKGTLSGTAPNLTYQPAAHYYGTDSFAFRCHDGKVDSSLGTISLTVQSVNDAPVAVAQSVSTDEDTAVAITLTGTDAEGDSLTYSLVQAPAHGTLSGTVPNVTYQPAADYQGPDSFTFQVTDSQGALSSPGTVSLTVRSVNDAPVAVAQSVYTSQDTAVAITLTGSDLEGDSLTYAVAQAPTKGTLSGTPPNVTYQPAAGYSGLDSFTFQVTDSQGALSNPGTVSIRVRSIDDIPVAHSQSVSTDEETPVAITLTGSDKYGSNLTYSVVEGPAHGTLSGTAPNVTYQPAADYHGPDSFTFQVTDSWGVSSSPGTVSLTVRPVNDAPVAVAQSVSTSENTQVAITLVGTDVDGDSLMYTVVKAPTNGTLSGTPPNLTYAPAAGYYGPDSFTFRVTDAAGVISNEATVSLTVNAVNDAPVATGQSATTNEDTQVHITLVGTDVDGDSLTYIVVQAPTNGTLFGTAPKLVYLPALNYSGPDSFTFQVRDTVGATSNVATVSLTVNAVNDYPVAYSQNVSTNVNTPVAITLTSSDVEGDPLRYRIAHWPTNGTVSGMPPNVTYQPAANFQGTDSFTFRSHDGKVDSNLGTIRITVGPGTATAVATAQRVSKNEATPVSIAFPGTGNGPQVVISASTLKPTHGEVVLFSSLVEDSSGGTLTYAWSFGDGSTSEDPHPSHIYANESAREVVLVVSNGVESGRAVLALEVLDAAPVLVPLDVPAITEEARPLTFQAPDFNSGAADTRSYSWNFGDGTPPVEGARVTHVYADDGTYTVTVTVRENANTYNQASRQVRVSNLPSQVEPVAPRTALAGQVVRFQLRATDVAGERDPLTWTLVDGPGSLTPAGLYSWTPPSGTTGELVVRARVADDEGGSSELLFRITVESDSSSVLAGGFGCTGSGEAISFTAFLFVALAMRSRRRSSNRTSVPSSN
jgi:hypothetical protein